MKKSKCLSLEVVMKFRASKILTLIFFLGIGMNSSFSQNELYDTPLVVFKDQKTARFFAHTSGLGVGFSYGKYEDPHHITTYNVELLNVRHEKERKRYNDYYDIYRDAKGFVYGKLNSFFILRPTYGKKKIFTDKLRYKGVQLGQNWEIGPSLGFAKPVYLEIASPSINFIDKTISIERYSPEEHDLSEIYGRASNLRGLNQLKLYPGIHLKYGLNVEYSNDKNGIKGIETGVTFDGYLTEIPIMAEDVYGIGGAENQQFLFNFYVNFFIGRKSSI